MRVLLWIVAILGALAGAAVLILGLLLTNGAPQEAAAFALACGVTVIPYVLARSWDEVSRKA